jgi:thiazole synthase
MNLIVNGEKLAHQGNHTLLDVLLSLDAVPEQVAVMLNDTVIRKEEYSSTLLQDNDSLEIMMMVGGGQKSDSVQFGSMTFTSRLILGTGKFPNIETMIESVKRSGTSLVTVALKRFNTESQGDDLFGPLSECPGVTIMPNTSGARTADEAFKAAMLGRELSGSSIVKVEIHPDPHHLLPDPIETLDASARLAKEGFIVMPYMPADPVLAKRLEDVGCASVMPLGAAIGSGRGLASSDMLRIILRDSRIPVIVDAGLRAPSEAAAAMEMGCSAVLVNSAIANAGSPPDMAEAFADAVKCGRKAQAAGLMSRRSEASPTSPLTSFLQQGAQP